MDILAFCEDQFIEEQELTKGCVQLIDEPRAKALYDMMGPATECSGGSAANTLAGITQMGGKTVFIGKVRDDQIGDIFYHDLTSLGVDFPTSRGTSGPATGRCYIFVTPDGERTMNTFLGICAEVTEADIDLDIFAQSKVTYIEGYLWNQPKTIDAIYMAIKLAHESGNKVAFTLSDVFCVDGHRDEFLALIDNGGIDILFANEMEIQALYQNDDFEACAKIVSEKVEIACLTRSEKGSVVLSEGKRYDIPAESVAKVVDSTGAGDLYAAGFLYGYTQGWDVKKSGELGGRCAAGIIQHLGARSREDLKVLVA